MTEFGAHLLGKQGPKWSFRSPVLLFSKKQAMVTLSTLVWGLFLLRFPRTVKREDCCGLFSLWLANRWWRGEINICFS